MVESTVCNSDLAAAQHDSGVANSNTEAELMSSSGSEGLQRQFSASSGDGLSDKEDVLAAVKSQVRSHAVRVYCMYVCMYVCV